MPITKPTFTANLITSLQANKIAGVKIPDLAGGIAQGVITFLPSITVSTTHTGLSGGGTGIGGVTLNPAQGNSFMIAQLQAENILGVNSVNLANAIVSGIKKEVEGNGKVQVAIAGTGPGTGVGSLTGMSPSQLKSLLMAGFQAHSIGGTKSTKLANAFSKAIVSWFGTGIVNTTDAGGTTVPPVQSVGQGTGKLF